MELKVSGADLCYQASQGLGSYGITPAMIEAVLKVVAAKAAEVLEDTPGTVIDVPGFGAMSSDKEGRLYFRQPSNTPQ